MKYLLLSLLSVPAFAAAFNPVGNFVFNHDFAMVGYENKAACDADQGRWEADEEGNGWCVFQGGDSVDVKKEGADYKITIDVIATNAHTCSFEAPAKLVGDKLVATAESQEWNDEKGDLEPATCEVNVSYTDGDTVNVTNNGKCTSFCGMRARLDFEGAKRQ